MPTIHEKVESLEDVLMRFIVSTQRFEDEMRAFKDEMRVFKDEMQAFKEEAERDRKALHDEMQAFKNEAERDRKALHDEMQAFKDEMRRYTERSEKELRRMNKQWGELANKMGTIVEDIVAPNIKGIAERYFGCKDIEDFMVRRYKRNTKDRTKRKEFDVIAVCDDKIIFNETKATIKPEYTSSFIEFIKNNEFFDYFPEYRGKEIIPVFSSLYLQDEVVNILTDAGIYAMAMTDDTMDLLNFDEVSRR